MKKLDTKMLVTAAILIALNIILSRFLSINAWNIKIGFTFISVFVAAYFYGPVFAAIVAGLGDFLGATLFPIGAYFPALTLSCILTGLIFGVFLYKKQTAIRVICAVVLDQFIVSLLINTYWISVLYGASFEALFMTRIFQCLAMTAIQIVTISILAKMLAPTRQRVLQQ